MYVEQMLSNMRETHQVQYSVPETRVWIFAHYPASARYSTLHFHIIFDGSEALGWALQRSRGYSNVSDSGRCCLDIRTAGISEKRERERAYSKAQSLSLEPSTTLSTAGGHVLPGCFSLAIALA